MRVRLPGPALPEQGLKIRYDRNRTAKLERRP
jgi:hypothetical protein